VSGKTIRQLTGPAKRGLNRALVNLGGTFGGRGGGQGRGRGAGPVEGPLTIGEYVVTVEVGGETLTKNARVRARIQ
jgi:hypothetical protein